MAAVAPKEVPAPHIQVVNLHGALQVANARIAELEADNAHLKTKVDAAETMAWDGDIITFEGFGRWPWLVRFAAWLSRVELPKRDLPRRQFVVTGLSSSHEDIQ